ncbi:hypothetical protein [Coraliomargarita parva]|uniref:hypothetical protein n=1 Tax=Coraliomargarita parva TaxID=3014050 RepID=UPI0022B33E61|nr:hypothetical protein [Coraliomargarita parva]
MEFIVIPAIVIGIIGMWFLLMKSESYKQRAIGGVIFLGLILLILDTYRLAGSSYRTDFYDSALNGIAEMIEKGRGKEVVEPIYRFQEKSERDTRSSFPNVAELASTISRLNRAEPVDTDNPVNPPENSKNQLDD